MAKQYISIKTVLDRLLRNNLLQGLSFESVIDYTLDFIDIVGIPSVYEDKFFEAEIENHRAKLPCDFIEEIQLELSPVKSKIFRPAREASDSFHVHYNTKKVVHNTDYTFTINKNFIFTSLEKGILQMAYKAIMTDEEGYPMIPSDRTFLLALEWYIKVQYYTLLWENGRLEDKRLEHANQEYAWAVGRCETDMKRLSLSKAENFFNSFRSLIPRDNEFAKRFQNTGSKEFLRVH